MIDAHFHVWEMARGDYDWLSAESSSLQRDHSVQDWAAATAATGITQAVLVQATPTSAETRFLLEVARRAAEQVVGVVGWAQLDAPTGTQDLAELLSDPLIVAIRPWLQGISDPDWILRDDVAESLALLERAGTPYEALVRPLHLPRLVTVLERHPRLRVVVDHGGKPDIASGSFHDWARDLDRVADFDDRVTCKLSGLLTEARDRTDRASIEPYARRILDAFGPSRVMWGSDWPVVTSVTGYREWFDMARSFIRDEDVPEVFGGTARRTYGFSGVVAGADR